jgi:Rps23 Pro-64 3,4-dihydroxylase Tpa1-like proline 4-hydroxylase
VLDRLFEPSIQRELRTAFAQSVPRPVLVEDFLRPDAAESIASWLDSLSDWRSEWFLEEFLGGTIRVAAEDYAQALPVAQFATWQTLGLDVAERHAGLRALLSELASDRFLACLRGLGPTGVMPARFKLRRYRPGDFFAPHTDGSSGMGLLIYLTVPAWKESDGGRFVYDDPAGQRLYPPHFNSALLFPYCLDAPHHVEPVAAGGAVRYTLGCDYA